MTIFVFHDISVFSMNIPADISAHYIRCGHFIFVDPDRVGVAQVIAEGFDRIADIVCVDPTKDFQIVTLSTKGALVGGQMCVPTDRGDRKNIFYARPFVGHGAVSDRYMRYVGNRIAPSTDVVTLMLKKVKRGDYEGFDLVSAHFGESAPFNPMDQKCPTEKLSASVKFWLTHALVDTGRGYSRECAITQCPWEKMGRELLTDFDRIFHG